jgi:hypothetical protein
MNNKHLMLAAAFALSAAGLRAEFSTSSVVINARSDPKNAPAIVAMAAIENPKFTLAIVRASVSAIPSRAVDIVRSVLRVDPKDAPEIVRQAILAQPSLAVQITTAALNTEPDQKDAIVRSAEKAAPADVRDSIADLSSEGAGSNLGNGTVSGGAPTSPSFPSQPVNAGLISPAS